MLTLTYQGNSEETYSQLESLLSEAGGSIINDDFFKGEMVLMVDFKQPEGKETFLTLLNRHLELKYKVNYNAEALF